MNINGKDLSSQEHDALRDMALVGLMSLHIKEYQFDYWNLLYGRLFPDSLVFRKVSPDGITEDEQEMRKKLSGIIGDPEIAKEVFDIVDKRDGKEGWKVLFIRRIKTAHKLGKIDEPAMKALLFGDGELSEEEKEFKPDSIPGCWPPDKAEPEPEGKI